MSLPNDPGGVGAPLNVSLNGQPRALPAASTLADLMADLMAEIDTADSAQKAPRAPPTNAATAVNGEFVPISRRAGRVLREGDQVTCFQLIVGG